MKKRVLIIEETLSLYNDPIFSILNQHVDLTFAYILKTEVEKTDYKTMQIPHKWIWKFVWLKKLNYIVNQYDVVIIVPHLKFINLALLPYKLRKFKLISWTIGLYVSYNRKYNLNKKPDFLDKLYEDIQDHCDACIFYMPHPIDFWERHRGIDREKYFVAHNTVKVADFGEMPPFSNRNQLLFVGSLYKQKGLGELLEAYYLAKIKIKVVPKLVIIGKGPEESIIRQQIEDRGLEQDIVMAGPIYNEEELKDYFLTSLLCLSPKQAGLSVQKSLGYGTPFVTRPDAITGGERLDVCNNINGFIYNTIEELSEIIVNAAIHPDQIEPLSQNARNYYKEKTSPEIMVQGVLNAINYVVNK